MPDEKEGRTIEEQPATICMNEGIDALDHFIRTGNRNLFRKWLVNWEKLLSEEIEKGKIIIKMDDLEKLAKQNETTPKEEIKKKIIQDFKENNIEPI